MIDTKTTDLLLKLRKGATASFTIGTVIKLADALGGWKFEKKVIIIALDRDTREMRDLLGADRELDLYRDSDSDGFRVEGAKGSPKVSMAFTAVTAVAIKPAKKLKAGTLYFTHVTAIKSGKSSWSKELRDSFTFKAQLAVESYTVTAPNGQTFDVAKEPGYRVITLWKLLPWMTVQGFVEQALAVLKMEPHGPAVPRTIDNSGTCPVCFGNFKLRADERTMVNHGYTQEYGHGQHRGDDCYGVKLKNFEVSSAGTKVYLRDVVGPQLAIASARASILNSEKTEGITKKKVGTDKSGRTLYRSIESLIYDAEQEAKSLNERKALLTFAVENWIAREPLVEGVPVPNYFKGFKG